MTIGHEGVLGNAVDKAGEDQHGHPNLLKAHLNLLQPGNIQEADDGVACQVDQHCHGEDETRHLLIQPVLVDQALEGDQVGGDGGGGAEVDQQSLRHVDVEAERVGAGQHEERDGQQQYQGKFTWRQNILLVALEWVQLISFSGHLE